FFVYSSAISHRDLHSFPTRRSSDLRRKHFEILRPFDPLGKFARQTAVFAKHFHEFFAAEIPQHKPEFQRTKTPAELNAVIHSVLDRKSTRLNSSHVKISYAVFCLKK